MPKDVTVSLREPETITCTDVQLHAIIIKILGDQDYYGRPDMFRVPPKASREAMANTIVGRALECQTNAHEEARRTQIMSTLDDLMSDFLYYDRQEDELLPGGAIEEAIHADVITIDHLVARFREVLEGAVG